MLFLFTAGEARVGLHIFLFKEVEIIVQRQIRSKKRCIRYLAADCAANGTKPERPIEDKLKHVGKIAQRIKRFTICSGKRLGRLTTVNAAFLRCEKLKQRTSYYRVRILV